MTGLNHACISLCGTASYSVGNIHGTCMLYIFALNLSLVCIVVASDTHTSLYTLEMVLKICKFIKGNRDQK